MHDGGIGDWLIGLELLVCYTGKYLVQGDNATFCIVVVPKAIDAVKVSSPMQLFWD